MWNLQIGVLFQDDSDDEGVETTQQTKGDDLDEVNFILNDKSLFE